MARTETKTLWRVEHRRTHRGPYAYAARYPDGYHAPVIGGYKAPNRPMPTADGIDDHFDSKVPEYRFGFASLQQLKAWFNKSDEIRDMAKHDFVISLYRAPRSPKVLIEGGKQVVFSAIPAERLKSAPISILLPAADHAKPLPFAA